MKFDELRDQWALKFPYPSEAHIGAQCRCDLVHNPHNESHKPKLRTQAEIVSDLAYKFADDVLKQQYGFHYQVWLESHTENTKTGRYYARERS